VGRKAVSWIELKGKPRKPSGGPKKKIEKNPAIPGGPIASEERTKKPQRQDVARKHARRKQRMPIRRVGEGGDPRGEKEKENRLRGKEEVGKKVVNPKRKGRGLILKSQGQQRKRKKKGTNCREGEQRRSMDTGSAGREGGGGFCQWRKNIEKEEVEKKKVTRKDRGEGACIP